MSDFRRKWNASGIIFREFVPIKLWEQAGVAKTLVISAFVGQREMFLLPV